MKNNIKQETKKPKYLANTFEISNEKQRDRDSKLDKENDHTFGQKSQNVNFDTIQIHDLGHSVLKPLETERFGLESKILGSQKIDVQTVVDDSEAYFNSIINQMK